MIPVIRDPRALLFHGDSKNIGRTLRADSVHAIVTDPPAGIGFMGKAWDEDKGGRDAWIAWLAEIMRGAFYVLKPGGHALVWAIPRTSHWTATALELAGFEIRDIVMHLFGTGFPKSLNVSKAIDQALGKSRATISERAQAVAFDAEAQGGGGWSAGVVRETAPGSPQAEAWEGWGTALKPAAEHWILARKPIESTVARNVLAHGTGGINVDACRIGTEGGTAKGSKPQGDGHGVYGAGLHGACEITALDKGRWPAHLTLDEDAAAILDAQSGDRDSHGTVTVNRRSGIGYGSSSAGNRGMIIRDKGGASRFFYVAKAPRSEKDAGLDHLPPRTAGEATDREEGSAGLENPRAGAGRTGGARNFHPTVKNLALMRWLCRLITPPGGTVLDLFAGSGSTMVAALEEGFSVIGVELTDEYLPIIEGRVRHALGPRNEPTLQDVIGL